MTIKINEKEIELKYSIRALMMYENITGNSFNPSNLTDILTFFYCLIVASTKDYSFTFEMFLDYIDENPDMIEELAKWITGVSASSELVKKN